MSNGVPFPQQVQQKGSIGGPIVDLRLEEIRAAQRFHDSRQQALEAAIESFGKSLIEQMDHSERKANSRHLGLGQDVENARLDVVKMLEAQAESIQKMQAMILLDASVNHRDLQSQIKATREHVWEIFWASAWAWTCRKSRATWERMKAPLWR